MMKTFPKYFKLGLIILIKGAMLSVFRAGGVSTEDPDYKISDQLS